MIEAMLGKLPDDRNGEIGKLQYRSSLMRNWSLALWVAMIVILVPSCSSGNDLRSALTDVREALVDSGFDDAGVHVGRVVGDGAADDIVTVVLVDDHIDAERATETGARVVWDKLPLKFDTLVIEYVGRRYEIGYAELEASLGPRPGNLDDFSIREAAGGLTWAALGFYTGVLVAVTLVVVLVIWLRRWRERGRF